MLHKLSKEEATGLLIDVPNWPTQTWWPYPMKMLIDFPLLLPGMDNMLYLPAQLGNPAGTQKQYHTYHEKWRAFCSSRNASPLSASLEHGLEFLHDQFASGLSYSALNTARSAVSINYFSSRWWFIWEITPWLSDS